MRGTFGRWLAFAALVACPASSPAGAAEFYQGKTLSILVNFTAGGPTDVEARLLARHIGKHIAGNPNIVVRNMGGASGVIGMNWLGELAPADGSVMGYFTGAASKTAIGEAGLRVDLSKFAFIASGPGELVTYMRTDVAPGIRTPADIVKAHDFWAAGLLPGTDKDVRTRMQLDMLGVKYHYISNYPGSAEARLALERNEIQMYTESMPTYRSAVEPNLVKNGLAIPICFDPIDDGENFSRAPEAEGIPAKTFPELLMEVKGSLPKGEMWDAYRLINFLGSTLIRAIVMPPGAPKEAVSAVKEALAELDHDAEFRADAMSAIKFTPRYVVDYRMERMFREKLRPDPKIQAWLSAYVEAGRAALGK
jgi:tripartite-type tricarboxylate transporter receptor subunit TctC